MQKYKTVFNLAGGGAVSVNRDVNKHSRLQKPQNVECLLEKKNRKPGERRKEQAGLLVSLTFYSVW